MPDGRDVDAPRKGASRIADIPPETLAALNAGRLETVTLVEWLAIDQPTLLRHALEDVGAEPGVTRALVERAEQLSGEGVTRRLKGIGAALQELAPSLGTALAEHRSDMVRAWAAYMLTADAGLDLAERLERARRFAADRTIAVRECAWDSFRPYVAAELDLGLSLLRDWVEDSDPNVRRCAVEGTRPRGVWTPHIEALKADPERGLPLLEPVRSDASRYVQRAVANWLNDASKSRPDWVVGVTDRWLAESPTPETRLIVASSLRTLRKAGRALV